MLRVNQAKENSTIEEELYRVGLIFLAAGCFGVFAAFKWIFPNLSLECAFQKFWGVYCPGCGGTRAVIALLHGQLWKSFCYHPIVLYTVAIFGWFMLSHTLEKLHIPFVKGLKYHAWHFYGALALVVFNCLLKNILKFGFHIIA